MSQRIFLLRDGQRTACKAPHFDADHVVAESNCPECNQPDLKLAGRGMRPSDDNQAWEADATALCCRKHVGTLRVEMNTLFGVREDEAVLRGRCRVY